MSYLDKLLEGFQVEWGALSDFADYEQPTKYLVRSNNYSDKYSVPVLTAGKTFILGYSDETDGVYSASKNPVIIFDDFTTANKWVDFDFKAKSSAMKMITSKDQSKALLKYIFYWLNTLPSGLVNGDHKRQWISNYSIKQIPIPPLEIQKEIVRILDKFTELIGELTAELAARKKQYYYYREALLNLKDREVEWKPLDEVYKFQYGTGNTIPTTGGIYPVYGSNGIVGTHSEYNSEDSPVIGHIGAYAGIVNFGKGKHFVTYNGVICKLINEKVNSRYGYHQLLKQDFNSLAKNSSHPFVSYKELNAVRIPIPSLEEQDRIVSILDKFDILTTSISEGLPKEIELRKKQYEYYRDLLLTFPKKAAL
jgi:type I restriction enzyme S subunit